MNMLEALRVALVSLTLNRTRAILTILGVVIGVAAVISLMGLGRGVERYVASQFESLGANILTVSATRPSSGLITAIQPLTTADVAAISNPEIVPGVSAVTAQYQIQGATVAANDTSVSVTVRGVTASYAQVNNWQTRGGTAFFAQQQIDESARVAILGTSTVADLFGESTVDPVGLSIQIDGREFTIIGVMEEQTSAGFQDPNEIVLVPITIAQTRLDNARVASGGYRVNQIQVLVSSPESIDSVTAAIKAYLMDAHDINNARDADFTVSNRAEILESITEVTSILTIFLSAIAGISLLVGGVGVMNIMLVSVSERTREIGLRKAVGARAWDILGQFLIESVVLSVGGGLLGIALGWGVMQIGTQLLEDLQLILTPDIAALAVGVSSFIGIFFGLYPANRAARMRPIDALRFE
jgi:putative ABC transport system permease protein